MLNEVRYSTLNSLGFSELSSRTYTGDSTYAPGNIALTEDDSTIYRSSRSPSGFGVADAETLVAHTFLPAGDDSRGRMRLARLLATAWPTQAIPAGKWFYNLTIRMSVTSLWATTLLFADDTRLIVAVLLSSNDFRIGLFNTPQNARSRGCARFMTEQIWTALTILAAVGAGLNAGLFFIFSNTIMRSLNRLPAAGAVAAMNGINAVIQNPLFFLVFFGTALLCLALLVGQLDSPLVVLGALLYLVGSLGRHDGVQRAAQRQVGEGFTGRH